MHPLDKIDSLRHKRNEFYLPPNTIYLDGNSLGPLPLSAKERALNVVNEQWGNDLISSWNSHDWIGLPQKVGDKIGRLIGAGNGQVVCCDSISVNVFKVLSAAVKMRPQRTVIATTKDNFPTDIYMAEGLISQLGDKYELRFLDPDDLAAGLGEDVAVVMLTQVNFRSGFKHNMQEVTQIVQASGALMFWDLAHSAGAFEVELDACNVDFAVGCSYKYLNGGPGAPAFVYVATRHQEQYQQPLSGWMGHRQPFAFDPHYQGAVGAAQNLCGTPGVIAMSILDAALNVFDGVSMKALRAKSLALMAHFIDEMKKSNLLEILPCVSPPETQRGSQLAFAHAQSYAICQAWIDSGVVADFRAPDILRIGFCPLYLSFEEVSLAVEKLSKIMREKDYLNPQFRTQQRVT